MLPRGTWGISAGDRSVAAGLGLSRDVIPATAEVSDPPNAVLRILKQSLAPSICLVTKPWCLGDVVLRFYIASVRNVGIFSVCSVTIRWENAAALDLVSL